MIAKREKLKKEAKQQAGTSKTRWTQDKMVLLAQREATLTARGARYLNQELCPYFPTRTLEAIKGVRRQEANRRLVFAEGARAEAALAQGVALPPSPTRNTVEPPVSADAETDAEADIPPDPTPNTPYIPDTDEDILTRLRESLNPGFLSIPLQSDSPTSDYIDEEYRLWLVQLSLPARVAALRGPSPPSRPPQEQQGAS